MTDAPGRRAGSFFEVLWRRRTIICLSLILAAAAGIAYLLLVTPVYTSEARIRYPQLAGRIVDGGPAVMDSASFLNTEVEVIGSTAVLLVALGNPAMDQVEALQLDPNPIRALKEGLDVGISRNTDLITVSYSLPNRFDAQTVVASVVDAYQTFQSKERQDALDALEHERRKIADELAERNRELLAFRKAHGQFAFEDDRNNPTLQRLASLSDVLTAAHLETVNAKTAYEEAAAAIAGNSELQHRLGGLTGSDPRITVADEQMLRGELFNLQQRLKEARRQYGENHPLVASISGRIDDLTVAFVGIAKDRWLGAERRQGELEKLFDQLQEQATALQATRGEYLRIEREAGRLEQLNDEIAGRFRNMSIVDGGGAMRISVLDDATLPAADEPSSPRVAPVMTGALSGGLLLGIGAALLVDWRDQRLRGSADVRSALGVPVLGVVPVMAAGATPNSRGLKAHLEPGGNVAAACRTLRTNLYFGLPETARTILITSPSTADGKSTLVSNLAIAMAQAGRRVLIIDADCRLPVQHKIFALQAGAGLTGVMAGRAKLEQAIVSTGIDNLELLACGTLVPEPAEILNSQDFSDLLGDLASQYDHILLDSPALTDAADARIIAAWCDATLLVLHADRPDRRLATIVRDGLIAVGANLTGVVVNGVDPQSRRDRFADEFDIAAEHSAIEQPAPAAPRFAETPVPDPQPEVQYPSREESTNGSRPAGGTPLFADPDLQAPVEPDDDELDWPKPEATQSEAIELGLPPVDEPQAPAIDESEAIEEEPEDQPFVGDDRAEEDQPAADLPAAIKAPQQPFVESRNLVTGLDPQKLAETSAELRRKFEALR